MLYIAATFNVNHEWNEWNSLMELLWSDHNNRLLFYYPKEQKKLFCSDQAKERVMF